MAECECRKCAASAIDALANVKSLQAALDYHYLQHPLDMGLRPRNISDETTGAQIDVLRTILRSQLQTIITGCKLLPTSPIAEVKKTLDSAETLHDIKYAVEGLDNALYRSLAEEG